MDNGNAEKNHISPTENQQLHNHFGVRKQPEDETESTEATERKRRKTTVNLQENLITSNDETVNEQILKTNLEICENAAQFSNQDLPDHNYGIHHKGDSVSDFQENDLTSEIDRTFDEPVISQESADNEELANQEDCLTPEHSNTETEDLRTNRNNVVEMLPQGMTLKQLQREIQCKNEELNQMKKQHDVAIKQYQLELQSKNEEIENLKGDNERRVKYLERSLYQAVLDSSSHKVNCLFEEVLRICLKVQCGGSNITTVVPRRDQMKVLKTCRLVCKSWREIIDRILEPNLDLFSSYVNPELGLVQSLSGPHPLTIQFPKQNWPVLQWIRYHLQLWDTNEIDSSPYNPLPTRHIFLDIKGSILSWTYFSGLVTKFLKIFGVHVWNVTVLCKDTPEVGTIKALNSWFQHLPLLKSLTIDFPRVRNNPSIDLQLRRMFDLQKFQFRGEISTFHGVIGNNPFIQKLHLDCLTLYTSNDWHLIHTKLPNLLELSVNIYDSNQMFSLETETWKIKTLATHFPQRLHESTRNLFMFMEMFRKNLTTLKLDCRFVQFTSPVNAYLNLPNLKSLSIVYRDWKTFPLTSFLSELKAVESLNIKFICYAKSTHNVLGNYCTTLTKESLCQILAKLKNLQINRRCRHFMGRKNCKKAKS